jgi:hypothetical protein
LLENTKSLDHSFSDLIQAGQLKAYKASPALFVQLVDKFQSKNVERELPTQSFFCAHEVAFRKGMRAFERGDLVAAHNNFEWAASSIKHFSAAEFNLGVVLALLTGGKVLGSESEKGTPFWLFDTAMTAQRGTKNAKAFSTAVTHNTKVMEKAQRAGRRVVHRRLALMEMKCIGKGSSTTGCLHTSIRATDVVPENGVTDGSVGYFLGVRYPLDDDDFEDNNEEFDDDDDDDDGCPVECDDLLLRSRPDDE